MKLSMQDKNKLNLYLSEKMRIYISVNNSFNGTPTINKKIACPITTDQNKRAYTTNYVCQDIKEEDFKVNPDNVKNLRIRKLTPKECWRLQGFDDEDVDKAAKVVSSSQLYKQAGNSITVNVLEAIFTNLFLKDPDEQQIGDLF